MTEKVEALPHDAGFLLSEANGTRSRLEITLNQRSTIYKAGTVLGKRSNGRYYVFDQDVSTGEEDAVAILLNDVDASAANTKGVAIVREAEVMGEYLVFANAPSTAEENAVIAALLALQIIVRTGPARVSTQTT